MARTAAAGFWSLGRACARTLEHCLGAPSGLAAGLILIGLTFSGACRADPVKGEVVRACVVVRPGHAVTADDLVARCRARVAPYKVPAVIDFLGALPKSPTGKILKKELRA